MTGSKHKVIVLVEDEKIIGALLVKKLEEQGYEVRTAATGTGGERLIRETNPDLVLLDMVLPEKDGYWVLEELNRRGILPKLPVIVISNSGQKVEIERALKLGVRDYLVKVDFDPREVIEKIKAVFEKESPSEAAPQTSRAKKQTAPETHSLTPEHDDGAPDDDKLKRSHVLIIEDDLFILELLQSKLRTVAAKISIAHDADEAVQQLAAAPVDLIMLDILLPKKDGFTFLKELKAGPYQKIPVVILSNLGQKEERERGLSFGAADYIVKADSSPAEIIRRSRDVLGT